MQILPCVAVAITFRFPLMAFIYLFTPEPERTPEPALVLFFFLACFWINKNGQNREQTLGSFACVYYGASVASLL